MSAVRGRARAGVAAVVLALVLAGCAAGDVDARRAGLLQQDVLAVTAAAAEGRLDAAAVLLERLRTEVDDAHGDGDLSDERHDEVTAALDDVAAQLEAGLAAQAAAAEAEAAAARDAAVAAAVAEAQARASAAEESARQAAAREAAAQEAALEAQRRTEDGSGAADHGKAEERAREAAEKAAEKAREVAEKAAEKAREAAARRGPGEDG
ncbi:hypothetical protein GC089_08740 [Cellulomonas sp. JZ18]|uniref:hypothetical protein n=1 Tax=Cellulomonas sp. JZ18 TaxID=2654191 RepID=UPI0012D3878F|nr:hypothetical protein [Cellulomonas sp. JZ18]QGQ19301.1 hypothetical protein GC089_08740 [Cellulomonas sp. JZ18]